MGCYLPGFLRLLSCVFSGQEHPRTQMLAHVSGMDETVGKIVESFKRHDFWDNTILIFSSDNGGSQVIISIMITRVVDEE